MEEFIYALLGSVLGYSLRHLVGERVWGYVRTTAEGIMRADPHKDAEGAVAAALIQYNLDRLAKEAKKVEEAFKPLNR